VRRSGPRGCCSSSWCGRKVVLLLVSWFGLELYFLAMCCIIVLVVVIAVLVVLLGVVVVLSWLVCWVLFLREVFSGLLSWLLAVVWPSWCGCVSLWLGSPLL
jgi:hypothetical protein